MKYSLLMLSLLFCRALNSMNIQQAVVDNTLLPVVKNCTQESQKIKLKFGCQALITPYTAFGFSHITPYNALIELQSDTITLAPAQEQEIAPRTTNKYGKSWGIENISKILKIECLTNREITLHTEKKDHKTHFYICPKNDS